MGSVVGTVGAKFGIIIPGPGIPTGGNGIATGQSYVLTSIYLPTYPVVANTTFYYVAFEFGWRAFVLQLVPNAAVGSVQVNVTLDGATAQGQGSAWEPLPAPTAGTGTWNNPMTNVAQTRLMRIDSGPWVAFQLVVSTIPAGQNAYVLFSAGG